MAETSTKPYLVRALYDWCCDNGYTPYLAVTVDADTMVPMQYVKGGEIVLNISPAATNRLTIGSDRIEFQARFSGVAQSLSIPVDNVTAIYARETGHGMAFDVTRMVAADDEADSGRGPARWRSRRRPGPGGPHRARIAAARGSDRRTRAGRRGHRFRSRCCQASAAWTLRCSVGAPRRR
ncbi:MAG: ClpXP protease specificity-enhancing factor [Burkholderiaceae bacterium]